MEPENMKWALDPGLALFTCPIVSNKVSQPSLSRCLLPKERISLRAAQNQPNLFMVTSPFPTLFVLLHVPYGIQIQSSLLPMIEVKIRNRLSAFLGKKINKESLYNRTGDVSASPIERKKSVIQKPNQLLELGRIGNQHDWSRPSLSSWM